jgi:hypothetical protein
MPMVIPIRIIIRINSHIALAITPIIGGSPCFCPAPK